MSSDSAFFLTPQVKVWIGSYMPKWQGGKDKSQLQIF